MIRRHDMAEEEKKRESFIFYRSFIDAIGKMPPKEYKETMQAIAMYALDGIEPAGLGRFADMAFALIKPQLDANAKRFENGCKGGRPKANENQTETETKPKRNQKETKKNQTETTSEPNHNVNVNDNVNLNHNLNDNLKNNYRAKGSSGKSPGSKISPFCCRDESVPGDLKTLEEILTQ